MAGCNEYVWCTITGRCPTLTGYMDAVSASKKYIYPHHVWFMPGTIRDIED